LKDHLYLPPQIFVIFYFVGQSILKYSYKTTKQANVQAGKIPSKKKTLKEKKRVLYQVIIYGW